MNDLTVRTIAVFARPFTVPGFGETLPAGEYDIETELFSPPDHLHPESWKASVLVKLHARASHPGLARTLTVSLADLDNARARDSLTGKELSDHFLEEMLSDPMVRMVMAADGVSERQLRHLYKGLRIRRSDNDALDPGSAPLVREFPVQTAENEGMPPRPDGGAGRNPGGALP